MTIQQAFVDGLAKAAAAMVEFCQKHYAELEEINRHCIEEFGDVAVSGEKLANLNIQKVNLQSALMVYQEFMSQQHAADTLDNGVNPADLHPRGLADAGVTQAELYAAETDF